MSIERKNSFRLNNWLKHGVNSSKLALSLSVCVTMLTGCASKPTVIAPDCPQPAPIPATLSKSDSPVARDYSKKVQNYLLKVQSLLKE